MRAFLFASNHVVLVNGFPTQDISIQKGLKQEDALTHFLFMLVAKGLSELVNRDEKIDLYSGFRVGLFNLVVSHIFSINDT